MNSNGRLNLTVLLFLEKTTVQCSGMVFDLGKYLNIERRNAGISERWSSKRWNAGILKHGTGVKYSRTFHLMVLLTT